MPVSGRPRTMSTREVVERLDRLRDHCFIAGWKREKVGATYRWWVDFPGAYRWYSSTQIGAFIDGANAMGAAP